MISLAKAIRGFSLMPPGLVRSFQSATKISCLEPSGTGQRHQKQMRIATKWALKAGIDLMAVFNNIQVFRLISQLASRNTKNIVSLTSA